MDKLKAGAAAISTTIGAINGIRQNQAKVQEAAIRKRNKCREKRWKVKRKSGKKWEP